MMLDRGELLKALRAFKRGDFSVRMPLDLTGIDGEIAQAFADFQNGRFGTMQPAGAQAGGSRPR